jgi:hypothetical protein
MTMTESECFDTRTDLYACIRARTLKDGNVKANPGHHAPPQSGGSVDGVVQIPNKEK